MTPDARVLQFPPSGAARPQEYGQFTRELSADELAGCFYFSDDQREIARRRGDANRLGFAVQIGTVHYLGRFLEKPGGCPRAGSWVDLAGDRRLRERRPGQLRRG
ncbi:MAG: DUF4158 domain-containing protein [Actinomycetota bacterium]|nr:DUF4158 domain-containing protein [Actinomycetota bacterium]